MRLKTCLVLFVVWVSGCAGPKVDYCLPGSPDYGCSFGPLPKDKAEGMICLNFLDQRSLLKACKLGTGLPDVNVCIVNKGGDTLACSDGSIPPAYGSDSAYACLKPFDFDRLLIYCKRKEK